MDTNVPFYKDNPNLDLQVVTTKSGQREYRCNCRKIKLEYYIKDVECFFVDGMWYRVESGLILYDHSKKVWVLAKNNNMVKGIVSFQGGLPQYGTFTPDPTKNILFQDDITGEIYPVIDEEIGKGLIAEQLSTGIYYLTSRHNREFFSDIKNIVNHKNKGYNIEDNQQEYANKVKVYERYSPKIPTDVIRYAKYLEDITFGAEIETIAGYLPEHIQHQTGTVICRDGSLHANDGTQGPEYVTTPKSGAKGVHSLITLCKELTKRNKVDHHCSLHFHIGNIPTSRLFMVSLYKLACMIQDDLFLMFPYYKIDEPRYANKDKNYCAKLKKLGSFPLRDFSKVTYDDYVYDNYIRIFTFLSNNVSPSKKWNRKEAIHPKADKWNRTARYHWMNLINTIFSKRNTVEFRIHQGTTNAQKVVTWLFICNAIVKTAMMESGKILRGENVTLRDVLDYYGKFYKTTTSSAISHYLNDYYTARVAEFAQLKENGDYMGVKEVNEDKIFFFEHSSFARMFK